MVAKTALFLGLVAAAVAEPIPQAAQTTSFAAAATSFDSFPTAINTAAESSLLSDLAILESILSEAPTLPVSVESVLATAIPTSILTESDFACQLVTATPDWYNDLPAGVKSALTSYASAAESWYSVHSAQFASLEAGLTQSGAVTYQTPIACTGAAAGGATAPVSTPTATGAGSGSGSGSSSGSGTAASSSKSSAGAAPTGAVTLGAAGVVGMLGLLAVL
jgi:hypothetical protein